MAANARPDYDAIWRSIEGSPFRSAYISEAYWLAARIVGRAREVFDDLRPLDDPTKTYIKFNHVLMGKLTAIIGDAVRLKAMLSERQRKAFNTDRQYQIHVRRARWLRETLLKDVRLKTIFESGVRNTLEHFDEYLDDVAIGCQQASIPRPTLIPFDVVVEKRKSLTAIDPEFHVEYLRAYIVADRVFVNADREINIRALHDEARRIVKRLKPLIDVADETDVERRRSAVMVLTDRSFPT